MDSFYDAVKKDIDSYAVQDTANLQAKGALFILIVAQVGAVTLQIEGKIHTLKNNAAMLFKVGQGIVVATGKPTYLGLSGALVQRHLSKAEFGTPILLNHAGELKSALSQLFVKSATEDKASKVRLSFDVMMALATYFPVQKISPVLVQSAVQLMQEEYGFLYGIDELSDRLGVNASHLIRVFKQDKGITPGRFLENTRIQNAKRLLVDGEMGLEMVAGVCGYANANYFGKVFKRQTGVTPHAYKTAYGTKVERFSSKIPDEYYL